MAGSCAVGAVHESVRCDGENVMEEPVASVSDILAARRPCRADAARNFDAILAAGCEVFSEKGADGTLEDIARRAGVGIATLYRNFSTKGSLVEAVCVAEVDQVCQYADEVAGLEPGTALDAWLHRFAVHLHTQRALTKGLTQAMLEEPRRESGAYQTCRTAIYAAGRRLLDRAQKAGVARGDVDIDDVMRFIISVTVGAYRDEDQKNRLVQLVIDSVHADLGLSRTCWSRMSGLGMTA
jgi:AcrR family transcriptional regulator